MPLLVEVAAAVAVVVAAVEAEVVIVEAKAKAKAEAEASWSPPFFSSTGILLLPFDDRLLELLVLAWEALRNCLECVKLRYDNEAWDKIRKGKIKLDNAR
jgi:hypothetical protein